MSSTDSKHSCCVDYCKSKPGKCESCGEQCQVMPTLGMCQVCTTGESKPGKHEVWKVHSLDCYKLRNRK